MSPEFLDIRRGIVANKTFQWMPADTEENYRKVKDLVPYGPNDITYKYNNYGFRCDDFNNWENVPYRILYAGCSMTEGIGVPLEDLWAKKLHNMICKKIGEEIPYWNIASGGTGLDHMIRYFYNLKDLLRPQIVISYLPNCVRRERWHEDRWSIWSLETVEDKDTAIMMNEKFTKYQTEKNLVMLNIMFEQINTYFLYSQQPDEYNVDSLNLSNFIYRDLMLEQIDNGRDNMHAGPNSNENYANKTFETFWPIIGEKLGLTNTK